jgi:hypothetical protein
MIGNAASEMGFWGRYFMVLALIVMPALAVASYIRIRSGKPLPPKARRYRVPWLRSDRTWLDPSPSACAATRLKPSS